MPKILITGNGFDLNLGLPTSYIGFIEVMSFVKSKNIDDINFQSVFSRLKNQDQFFKQFNPFEIDKAEIENIKPILEKNLWFKYFEEKSDFETWIDFEQEIEFVILKINKFMSSFSKEDIGSIHQRNGDAHLMLEKIKRQSPDEFFIVHVFDLVQSSKSSYQINSAFCNQKYNSFSSWNKPKFFEFLVNQLHAFVQLLNFYFAYVIQPLIEAADFGIWKDKFQLIESHFTFNYTRTFEFLKSADAISQHLHGKANKEENPIVLGFNEIPEEITDKS